MSISAINAFLKTCEEPLPNRIILATTANKSQILETIISRSITISFDSKDLIFKNDLTSELENVVKTLASNENIHNKHSFLVDINKR
jgi:DNA polymerase III gamma/tau subunit